MDINSSVANLLAKDVKKIFIGYSGGIDSTVLLHFIHALYKEKLDINAVHINHNILPMSKSWQIHCQDFCAQTGIKFQVYSIQLTQQTRRGTEYLARQARENIFKQLLTPHSAILLAHHQSDQTENFFIRLLRGSGVKGLASMQAINEIKPHCFKLRPLLTTTKSDIINYANTHTLSWIEDPSNFNTEHTRSWLRTNIIPAIKKHYPALERNVNRTANIMQDTQHLLNTLANEDLQKIEHGSAIQTSTQSIHWLDTHGLKKFDEARCCNLLRFWLGSKITYLPSKIQLERINRQLCQSTPHKSGIIELGKTHTLDKLNHKIRLSAL